jgi:hypothetical protein
MEDDDQQQDGDSLASEKPDEVESCVWEVLWKEGGSHGQLQRIMFESSTSTRTFLHNHVERWSAKVAQDCSELMRASTSGKQLLCWIPNPIALQPNDTSPCKSQAAFCFVAFA